MESQAPNQLVKIQVETVYGKFKFMGGNRKVDYNHVKRLKEEMQSNPELLQAAPILVNESMYIVDGQHRFEAAKELRVPIYYIMKHGLTIDAARHMNVTQKKWIPMDFAESYSQGGNEEYTKFINMVKKFPKIAPSIIMKYLAGGQKHRVGESFRLGKFKIEDFEKGRQYLEKLDAIIAKTHLPHINTPMALSLLQMFQDEDTPNGVFNYQKFMEKLEHEGAIALFVPGGIVRNCLRSIEDVFNFQSRTRIRLY